MSGAGAPPPSFSDRMKEWWSSLELATQFLVSLNTIVFIAGNAMGMSPWEYCFNPYLVVQLRQIHRIFTAPFLHGNLLHIVFNMMALSSYGPLLGREIGTFPMLYLVFLFILTSGVISTVIAYGALYLGTMQFMMECGVGFSGVLFALIVVDNHVHQVPSRSIFGCFSVPAKFYPVALLAFLQLIIPSVSLLGHASGLVAGYLFVWGWLRWFVPLSTRFGYIEHLSCLNCVCGLRSFVYSSSGLDWYGSQNALVGRAPHDGGGGGRVRDFESGIPLGGGNGGQWTGVGRVLGGRTAAFSDQTPTPAQSMPNAQISVVHEEKTVDEKKEVPSKDIEDSDEVAHENDDLAALVHASSHHHHYHDGIDDSNDEENGSAAEDDALLQ